MDSVLYTETEDWRLMAIQIANHATNLPLDAPGPTDGPREAGNAASPEGYDAASLGPALVLAVVGVATFLVRGRRDAGR